MPTHRPRGYAHAATFYEGVCTVIEQLQVAWRIADGSGVCTLIEQIQPLDRFDVLLDHPEHHVPWCAAHFLAPMT